MVALLFVGTPVAGASCGGRASAAADSIQRMRHAVRCRLNVIRSTRGLPRLHGNHRLAAAATRHSRAMARQQFFAHDSPAGDTMVSRVRAVGYLPRYGSWTLGENLAWGPEAGSSPRSIVRAWMASPAHRANIVSPLFRDIGIGIAIGTPFGGQGAVYTTDFGRRR